MHSRCLSLGLAAIVVVGSLAACGDTTGVGGGGGAGGSGSGGAPEASFQTSKCGECALDACATEIADCQADPGCAAYLDCLLQCPLDNDKNADPACDAGCLADASTETLRVQSKLNACRFYGDGGDCADCAVPTAPENDLLNQMCEPRPDPPTACRACYWEHCCDTWDACFDGSNPDCDALVTCIQACGDPIEDCNTACFDAHPNSVQTVLDQVGCSVSECASDTPDCDDTERDDCSNCMFEDCGDPFISMITTPDGWLLYLCLADCGNVEGGVPCTEDCFAAHPDAEPLGFAWADCIAYQCETRC